jgi:hypothetical protein
MKPKATPVSENTIESPTRGHKEMKNEKKEVFTLQIERMDEYGEYEVVDEMKYAKIYYSFDDAVEDGKKAYDEYSAIEDKPVSVSIMGGEYEMPNGDIYGEPECLETIRAKNRNEFNESMKKINVTKERFEKSRYFTKKYGKLKYVSESGNMYKTNKGKILMFKESIKDIAPGIQDWGTTVYVEPLDVEMSWDDVYYIVKKDCRQYPLLE